ncbi:MAG TPA: winged helix-turn-helix transcriptional regulator [Nitrososphaeraceae archaeon]|nr:winged helix-turn-helix transcriptional regulator [Nitrososphaeraceae archaeon]
MPVELDEHDISILKSLFKDGRKSFRQISRETGITTPTVKARFERLVNIGFIQGVVPLIDFGKIDKTKAIHELSAANKIPRLMNIKKGIKIMLDCDYCHGVIAGAPQVFKFANYERFFCCVSCKSEYKRKYGGRIQTIIENYVK